MAKTGKSAKDIFAATGKKATEKKRPGRPPVHDESWSKVTVTLFNRQIGLLDRIGADIRIASGSSVSRSEILRAMIDAMAEAEVELTTAKSEADVKAIIAKALTPRLKQT